LPQAENPESIESPPTDARPDRGETRRAIFAALFGILGGLLGAGLIWLVANAPRGEAVTLRPPPTPVPILVHVDGAVSRPGVYPLPEGSRVQDALDAAGGPLEGADSAGYNLAARLEDGDRLWIPVKADESLAPQAESPPSAQAYASGEISLPGSSIQLININEATQAELESLPGIGPATAMKIISYREESGPFTAIEDIMNVSGIGPATFEKIQDRISVGTGIDPR
jgi:competence protein ComEA